jgi:hypothetical protein
MSEFAPQSGNQFLSAHESAIVRAELAQKVEVFGSEERVHAAAHDRPQAETIDLFKKAIDALTSQPGTCYADVSAYYMRWRNLEPHGDHAERIMVRRKVINAGSVVGSATEIAPYLATNVVIGQERLQRGRLHGGMFTVKESVFLELNTEIPHVSRMVVPHRPNRRFRTGVGVIRATETDINNSLIAIFQAVPEHPACPDYIPEDMTHPSN